MIPKEVPCGAPVFSLTAVTVRRRDTVLLEAVTCDIAAGSCTALVGPSGAGKSTLLRLLNRLEEPSEGAVYFRGRPLPDLDVLDLRRRVALVGQQPTLLTDSVLAEMRVGRPRLAHEEAGQLLDLVGLGREALVRSTAGMSVGEAQRLGLARALAVQPDVLLLDEPTSALDPRSAAAIETAVRDLLNAGLAVVLVSHNPHQARRLADRALVLSDGILIAQGAPEDLAYLHTPDSPGRDT